MFYKTSLRQGLFLFCCLVTLLTLSDQISDGVFKAYFQRLRPTHHPEFSSIVHIVNGYRGGKFGFVSSHAANSFAFAVFFHFVFQNKFFSVVVFGWASFMCFTRIYLGVHFISDVVVGSFVGGVIGYLIFKMYLFVRLRFLDKFSAKACFIKTQYLVIYSCFWSGYMVMLGVWSFYYG